MASTCEAVDRDSAADVIALFRELRERVRVIVRKLGRNAQRVLELWFEGLEPREIAVALGIPAANVRVILHRTLSAIRQALRECDNGGTAERPDEEWLNLATKLAHPSGILDKSASSCYKYPQCTFKHEYRQARPRLPRHSIRKARARVPVELFGLSFGNPGSMFRVGGDESRRGQTGQARSPISSRGREDIMVSKKSATSAYAALYLGDPTEDPSPVFRDLSPNGVRLPDGSLVPWPKEAVFAVLLATEPTDDTPLRERLEFYEADGWPVGFPIEFRDLAREVKHQFQVSLWNWRTWAGDLGRLLERLRHDPLRLRRLHIEAGLIHGIYPSLPTPVVPD